MIKDSEIKIVETNRSFTAKNPRVLLARALECAEKGVRVTENPNLYGSYRIEYTRDGLNTMSEIKTSQGYHKLLGLRNTCGDELTTKLMVSLARNILVRPSINF